MAKKLLKTPILGVQGRSRSSTLKPPENLSAALVMLVMISSKSAKWERWPAEMMCSLGSGRSVVLSVCVRAQRRDVIRTITSLRNQQIVYCLWRHQQQRLHYCSYNAVIAINVRKERILIFTYRTFVVVDSQLNACAIKHVFHIFIKM